MSLEFSRNNEERILASSPFLAGVLRGAISTPEFRVLYSHLTTNMTQAIGTPTEGAFLTNYISSNSQNGLVRELLPRGIDAKQQQDVILLPTLIGFELRTLDAVELFVDTVTQTVFAHCNLPLDQENALDYQEWVRSLMHKGALLNDGSIDRWTEIRDEIRQEGFDPLDVPSTTTTKQFVNSLDLSVLPKASVADDLINSLDLNLDDLE